MGAYRRQPSDAQATQHWLVGAPVLAQQVTRSMSMNAGSGPSLHGARLPAGLRSLARSRRFLSSSTYAPSRVMRPMSSGFSCSRSAQCLRMLLKT